MIRSYTTLAGAARNRGNGSIIRILCDPDDLFVVVPSFLQTKIMSVEPDTGKADGSIGLMQLATRGAA